MQRTGGAITPSDFSRHGRQSETCMRSQRGQPVSYTSAPVTLQISLAPNDLPTARHTVPHQIRVWGGHVDEILLTVDLHRSSGRYGEGWQGRLPGLRQLIADLIESNPKVRTRDVDYGPEANRAVGKMFFGGQKVPAKDRIGAPFYSFFFAVYAAAHDHVLHVDSDMMFGGGSATWLVEAATLLADRAEVATVGPLPGPPTQDGSPRSQALERDSNDPLAYRAHLFSQRVCLVHRPKFLSLLGPLPLSRPSALRAVQARLEGNPPIEMAETIISNELGRRRLYRIETLGQPPGMWAVHPAFRSEAFYARLPGIIRQVETGTLDEAQNGHHDLVDRVIDFSGARKPRWWRIGKKMGLVARRLLPTRSS
jgi:hypothetical protein